MRLAPLLKNAPNNASVFGEIHLPHRGKATFGAFVNSSINQNLPSRTSTRCQIPPSFLRRCLQLPCQRFDAGNARPPVVPGQGAQLLQRV